MINNYDSHIYFDTNALIKYYRDELGTNNIRNIVTLSEHPIIISPLTIVEFIGNILRFFRSAKLSKSQLNSIIKRISIDIGPIGTQRKFNIHKFSDDIFTSSYNLILKHGAIRSIGSYDSMHLSCVLLITNNLPTHMVLVTSDRALKTLCEKEKVVHYDPEKCRSCLDKIYLD